MEVTNNNPTHNQATDNNTVDTNNNPTHNQATDMTNNNNTDNNPTDNQAMDTNKATVNQAMDTVNNHTVMELTNHPSPTNHLIPTQRPPRAGSNTQTT